jgi:hypothetical protein
LTGPLSINVTITIFSLYPFFIQQEKPTINNRLASLTAGYPHIRIPYIKSPVSTPSRPLHRPRSHRDPFAPTQPRLTPQTYATAPRPPHRTHQSIIDYLLPTIKNSRQPTSFSLAFPSSIATPLSNAGNGMRKCYRSIQEATASKLYM